MRPKTQHEFGSNVVIDYESAILFKSIMCTHKLFYRFVHDWGGTLYYRVFAFTQTLDWVAPMLWRLTPNDICCFSSLFVSGEVFYRNRWVQTSQSSRNLILNKIGWAFVGAPFWHLYNRNSAGTFYHRWVTATSVSQQLNAHNLWIPCHKLTAKRNDWNRNQFFFITKWNVI